MGCAIFVVAQDTFESQEKALGLKRVRSEDISNLEFTTKMGLCQAILSSVASKHSTELWLFSSRSAARHQEAEEPWILRAAWVLLQVLLLSHPASCLLMHGVV